MRKKCGLFSFLPQFLTYKNKKIKNPQFGDHGPLWGGGGELKYKIFQTHLNRPSRQKLLSKAEIFFYEVCVSDINSEKKFCVKETCYCDKKKCEGN